MPKIDGRKRPQALIPFWIYGVDLSLKESTGQANGDCPFCGKDGKLSVNSETTEWDCKSCGASGNWVGFVRQLYECSDRIVSDYAALATLRPPIQPETFMRWGVLQSFIDGVWMVPGYGPNGKLNALYRWTAPAGTTKRRLQTSGDTGHQLCGMAQYDQTKSTVWLCEGAWDGMAWWQALNTVGKGEDGELTEVPAGSERCLLADASVLAVPGCNIFKDHWCELLAGKHVIVAFHNDHAREHPPGSGNFHRAGWDGSRRVTEILASSPKPPESIDVLCWGRDGHDPDLPNGFDLRDAVARDGPENAVKLVLSRVAGVPAQWTSDRVHVKGRTVSVLQSMSCSSFRDLTTAWRIALKWRRDLEDVLSVMLAVALSTDQIGDQLFLQVIGEAGSAKTRLCDGMLVSNYCFPLEHLTGFYSGWKDPSGKDFSLLPRANGKTMITPEGDVIVASPKFSEIMSQQRRIFDGTSGTTFKNRDKETRYTGLRTPWIMAGTPALLEQDQSRLGDRFLQICIDRPCEEEIDDIQLKIGWTALRSVRQSSNGHADGQTEETMTKAYKLTGGYVDYLRTDAYGIINNISLREEEVIRSCAAMAKIVADFRARPHPDHKREIEAYKEVPSRVTAQFVRLAVCLAGVLNKREVDGDVMRLVAKVAADSSRGKTWEIARHLVGRGAEGSSIAAIAVAVRVTEERAAKLLWFLSQIDVVEIYSAAVKVGVRPHAKWRLTSRVRRLLESLVRLRGNDRQRI